MCPMVKRSVLACTIVIGKNSNFIRFNKPSLLGSVDPDDIQVAVVDALFILVRIAGTALRSGLWLGGIRHL